MDSANFSISSPECICNFDIAEASLSLPCFSFSDTKELVASANKLTGCTIVR